VLCHVSLTAALVEIDPNCVLHVCISDMLVYHATILIVMQLSFITINRVSCHFITFYSRLELGMSFYDSNEFSHVELCFFLLFV